MDVRLDVPRLLQETVHWELAELGFEHYEVSNYARDGHSRSRHNQIYWSGRPYAAYGLGASSYVSSRRSVRPRSLEAYCAWVEQEGPREGCEEDASAEPFA